MSIITRAAAALGATRREPARAEASAPSQEARSLARDTRVAASGLGPADQRAYQAVHAALDAEGRTRLRALAATGTLAATDAKGASLVANLHALLQAAPPAGAAYTPAELVAQALAHVAAPATIAQGDRNTCGATTVQYVLATERPAEYVRLVAGLAGAGRVALAGGPTMALPPSAIARDDSGRDDVERLVQTAFQNYGGDFRGSYSNETDRTTHANGTSGGLRGLLRRTVGRAVDWVVERVDGAKGNAEGKIAELYRDTTGREAALVGDLPGGVFLAPGFMRADVWDAVSRAVARGVAVPADLVIAGLEDHPDAPVERVFEQTLRNYPTQMKSHQVLVTAIEGGRVHYRNPWGYEASMSEREFRSRLTDAIVPR